MYGGITGEFSEPIQDDIEQTIEASSEQRKGEETLLIFRSSECSDEQRKKLRELVRYMEIPCSVVTSSPKAPRCPLCKQLKRKTRKIAIFNGMVQALAEVFRYCERKGSFEFTTREIKRDYLEPYGTNVTARFGDWDYFGGLILAKRNTDGIKAK